jgi:AraC-like DNA-binding protein
MEMPDRLAALMANFSVSARTFHSGRLCGINTLEGEPSGQLHLIRDGDVEVRHGRKLAARIVEPSLLLYPRPMVHRFVTDKDEGAEFLCAHLGFDGGTANPIANSLPEFTCITLAQLRGSEALLGMMFEEAAAANCGRQEMLNRLFEVLLIQILRHLMEQGQTQVGMLAGLSHRRLQMVLIAMHESPGREWSLEDLADVAGMSRSVFANQFRDTVGVTPGAYLQRWRIGLAQKALREGRSLKHVAQDVGYGSEAALSRAFKAQSGLSPREWRRSAAPA